MSSRVAGVSEPRGGGHQSKLSMGSGTLAAHFKNTVALAPENCSQPTTPSPDTNLLDPLLIEAFKRPHLPTKAPPQTKPHLQHPLA